MLSDVSCCLLYDIKHKSRKRFALRQWGLLTSLQSFVGDVMSMFFDTVHGFTPFIAFSLHFSSHTKPAKQVFHNINSASCSVCFPLSSMIVLTPISLSDSPQRQSSVSLENEQGTETTGFHFNPFHYVSPLKSS